MALNKDVLGAALYSRRNSFNDKTLDELIAEYGTLENLRLAICKADAEEIINHFKSAALITLNPAGLTAGATAVTGTAVSILT